MESKRSSWIIHYISEYVLEACARFEEELNISDLHSTVEDSYGEQYVISVMITTPDYCKGIRIFFDESVLQTKSLKEIGEICEISLEGGYLAIKAAMKNQNDIVKIVGTNLQNARLSAHISQKELAKRLKISQARVSEYERGLKEMKIRKLIDFANALNVSVQNLLL